jgi:hypothetical protein
MMDDDVLRAAADVLGERLGDPVDLGGSGRSSVVRCSRLDGGEDVVVKAYPQTTQGWRGFAAEAAGLAFCGLDDVGPGAFAPRLLGVDREFPLVVLSYLAGPESPEPGLQRAPSLADLLLGPSASAAVGAWLDWAAACGRLAAVSAGKQEDFARLRAEYASYEDWGGRVRDIVLSAADLVAPLEVAVPGGIEEELADVVRVFDCDYQVFSPGDICPDNALVTAEGIRFVDFESAGFHTVFADAAYLRMPFSSCWCVLRMPAGLAAAGEKAYRAEVAAVFGELKSDAIWESGVLRAMAAWTVHAMSYLLDRAVRSEQSMNEPIAAAPGRRQLLRYRWQTLAEALSAADELPALSELMSRLIVATEHWQAPVLPLYPALRRT